MFFLPNLGQAQLFSEILANTTAVNPGKMGLATTSNSILTGITKIDVSSNFRETIRLIRVAHNGNLQESFLYASLDNTSSINCQQILPISEENTLVSGTYKTSSGASFPFIMSINSAGNVNWAKKIDKLSDHSPDLTVLSDNSILCIIKYSEGAMTQVYCKIDALGNLSSFFEIDDPFKIKKDILVKNGSFDLLFLDGNLLNINNNLSTINWQRKYQHVIGVAANRTLNTDYVIATCQVAFPGYMTITRTTSDGVVLWCKYIESWLGTNQNQGTVFDVTGIDSIKEDATGNIIVYGQSEGGSNGTFQVTLDANGGYLSNYKSTTYQNKILPYGTGELLIVGYANSGDFNTSNIILQKRANSTFTSCDVVMSYTFTDGTQVMPTPDVTLFTPSTTLATTPVSVQKTNTTTVINEYCNIPLSVGDAKEPSEIQVFPIPSSEYIEITTNAPIKEINVYDVTGKLLIKTQYSKINISMLANAVYILEIVGVEKTVVRKIIKN